MTIISNPSGDHNDKIANAAKVLGRSKTRKDVFNAIYNGKRRIKKVSDIEAKTGMSNMRVLQEADRLYAADIVKKVKVDKQTAYEKIDFYTHNKTQILRLSNDKKKFNKFPTKVNPGGSQSGTTVKVSFPKKIIDIKELTVDDIDNFKKVKKVSQSLPTSRQMAERKLKSAIQKLMSEKGKFTDWGGEANDLYTSRLFLNGKRKTVAFAFKGKGTKGVLTPKKLGKNGDQIQRLFKSPAQVFIVQYQGQIDQSVIEQMKVFSIAKSVTEGTIYYGVVNGQDTERLIKAYPNHFK